MTRSMRKCRITSNLWNPLRGFSVTDKSPVDNRDAIWRASRQQNARNYADIYWSDAEGCCFSTGRCPACAGERCGRPLYGIAPKGHLRTLGRVDGFREALVLGIPKSVVQ